MKIKEGFAYHLNDQYFDLMQECNIKSKTAAGRTFPAYCCYVDKFSQLIWMVPMSTNMQKYQTVYDKEKERYGRCLSIVFGEFDDKLIAFQVQGMFPVMRKHILHPHTRKGRAIPVERAVKEEVRHNFDELRELERKGAQCILSDIKLAEELLLNSNSDGIAVC